jgi:hypothetical protein
MINSTLESFDTKNHLSAIYLLQNVGYFQPKLKGILKKKSNSIRGWIWMLDFVRKYLEQ